MHSAAVAGTHAAVGAAVGRVDGAGLGSRVGSRVGGLVGSLEEGDAAGSQYAHPPLTNFSVAQPGLATTHHEPPTWLLSQAVAGHPDCGWPQDPPAFGYVHESLHSQGIDEVGGSTPASQLKTAVISGSGIQPGAQDCHVVTRSGVATSSFELMWTDPPPPRLSPTLH